MESYESISIFYKIELEEQDSMVYPNQDTNYSSILEVNKNDHKSILFNLPLTPKDLTLLSDKDKEIPTSLKLTGLRHFFT